MSTKEDLIGFLESKRGSYVSGSEIARSLGITRAAVWKQMDRLKAEGWQIEAVTNRGYRLGETNDVGTKDCLTRYLGETAERCTLEVYDEVTSTNSLMKEKAESLPAGHVIVSGMQSAGRGRSGRSFYSPSASGIYLSVLLRPQMRAEEAARITTVAAVAACRAIESCTEAVPGIKWVNDIFVGGRKVSGILTEASLDMETGGLSWAVMGIGFNVYEPENGFPEEIRETAGAIVQERRKDLRCRIVAAFLKEFFGLCGHLGENAHAAEYRRRSFLIGKHVTVVSGRDERSARVYDIDDDCRLLVEYEDGSREALFAGEVRVRPDRDAE